MCDTIFNLMVLGWHFQIKRNWRPRVSYNPYHREHEWPDGKWKMMQVGSFHF